MIYGVVEATDRSVIKIGYTKTVDNAVDPRAVRQRLNAMQNASWRSLVCIAMQDGTMADECALHTQFEHYRVRGEWFLNHGDVADWAASCRSQVVNVQSRRRFVACVWPRICECSRCVSRRAMALLTVV